MTLTDFATFCTALSGIAVTASLIYLALQTHQSVKHTRALIHQGRASRIIDHLNGQLSSDVAAAVIVGNGGVPTPEAIKALQFSLVCRTNFTSFEDTYSQFVHGLVDESTLRLTRKNLLRVFSQPGFRAAWDDWKEPGTGFADFVDGVLASTPNARRCRLVHELPFSGAAQRLTTWIRPTLQATRINAS
jgi:hypothetical protein